MESTNQAIFNPHLSNLASKFGATDYSVENLPASVKRRIYALKHLQSQHASLEANFQEEVLALEKKYLDLYRPLYEKRSALVNGSQEPTDEEIKSGREVDAKERGEESNVEETKKEEESEETPVTGVPEFWLTAMKNHLQLAELITERDEEALKHLVDIRLAYLDKPGFRLEFEFASNDFFENTVLSKTYYYQEKPGYGGDFVYDRAEGTEIKWKDPSKNLSITLQTKVQRRKGTSETRVVKKTVSTDTFFSFFAPPSIPADDEVVDEDDLETLEAKLEADYELGEEFKDKLIPHAVDWFTGKALEYEDVDADDYDDGLLGDEDNEDDDEEDLDELDDDDDEIDDAKPKSKGDKAPECNQQ
ncbi:uncharacterized protein VTP21DRAFT_4591 [Calcarisporiella thermophila]|uniref:uncharacterized protein n=1 Tax=Calcarisporiella thermophila TaxID=911321 RepID=UPI0037421FA9